jgi:hypothetical protein
MGFWGKILGNVAGGIGSKVFKLDGVNGGEIGSQIGGLLPFKNGGAVGGPKGRPKKILAHGGEYVLPANAKPTKAQRAIVAKNKAAAKKKGKK